MGSYNVRKIASQCERSRLYIRIGVEVIGRADAAVQIRSVNTNRKGCGEDEMCVRKKKWEVNVLKVNVKHSTEESEIKTKSGNFSVCSVKYKNGRYDYR